MIELEKKSWINNPVEILDSLYQKASYIKSFKKKDFYYTHFSNKKKLLSLIENSFLSNDLKIFRIRKIKNEKCTLTYKQRQIKNSCELNKEYEISFRSLSKWKKFFQYIGYKIFVKKIKTGKLFQYQDFFLEYCYIQDLGYFLEIEILNPKKIDQSIKDLDSIFKIFNLNHFEEKPYIHLILQKKIKNKK